MFIGHYGASFAAKRVAPEVPLWLLFVAAQWVDILWAGFILLGVEQVAIVPGITATNALDLRFVPYTHSLLAAFLWALFLSIVAAFCLPVCRTRRAVIAIAAVTFSHWLLDGLVHRPDLPLWGDAHKVGLGLWNYPLLSLSLELLLLIGAAVWLLRSPPGSNASLKPRRWSPRRWSIYVAVLALLQIVSLLMPPPASVLELGLSALISYLTFAVIAAWLERDRLIATA